MANVDPIAAIATPPGRGGIGVVRLSGENLQERFSQIYGGAVKPRHASLRKFIDAQKNLIDQGVVLYYPAPHSYTGEDVIELQSHGSPMVLRTLLERCISLGARVAEPGEFTKRAFLNDKMDLAQAEAVADLIDSSTRQAASCAQRSLQGDFSLEIHGLVKGLIEMRVSVEANIDFPEETEQEHTERASEALKILQKQLNSVIIASRRGSLIREGGYAVLAGEPNVGKSSLLNALSCEDVAIVTDIPGTTRDPIREKIELDGVPIHIIDTAGLREAKDEVEQEGINRTLREIGRANIAIVVIDSTSTRPITRVINDLPAQLPRVFVYNKIDLSGECSRVESINGETRVWLSAKTGEGIDILRKTLLEILGWGGNEEGVFMARTRHLQAMANAQTRLVEAGHHLNQSELFAEDLSLAQKALATITGEFTADDLLGEIFSHFCIGK